MNQLPEIEARVFFVIYTFNTMEKTLVAIHTLEDKQGHESEAVHIGRIRHGDLEVLIYSPVELTKAEANQFEEHALRVALGQFGSENMPRYSESGEVDKGDE